MAPIPQEHQFQWYLDGFEDGLADNAAALTEALGLNHDEVETIRLRSYLWLAQFLLAGDSNDCASYGRTEWFFAGYESALAQSLNALEGMETVKFLPPVLLQRMKQEASSMMRVFRKPVN